MATSADVGDGGGADRRDRLFAARHSRIACPGHNGQPSYIDAEPDPGDTHADAEPHPHPDSYPNAHPDAAEAHGYPNRAANGISNRR